MTELRSVITFLTSQRSYPIKLARKIGVEASVVFFESFIKHGELEFAYEDPVIFGVLDGKKTYQYLVNLKYFILEGDKYKVSLNKIIEVSDYLVGVAKPPFHDKEFLMLLHKFEEFLAARGRKVTKEVLYGKFEGKSLEQSIKALTLSLDNKFVTLMFNENNKGTDENREAGSGIGNWKSGGAANSETTIKDTSRKI